MAGEPRSVRARAAGTVCTAFALGVAALSAAAAQAGPGLQVESQLRRLFPAAASFSARRGNPPHFEVYAADPPNTVVGLAFWTTDLDPLERGYDGPIKILVGLDPRGLLTGVIVADHHEPYGYFSVDQPEFAAQFAGKNIRDEFRVGTDVQAVSRATLTVTSASRAIRNSARRVANALLKPPDRPAAR